MNPSSHHNPEGKPCVGCHVSRVTDRESKRKQKRTLTNTGSCTYTRRRSHTHTCLHRRATHSHTHMHEHRYASSHAHRLAAPLNILVLVARTIAGGKPKGKRRQLHSACRQTTVPSGVGYRILVIVVGGNSYVSRPIPTQVVIPITCLQGTGQAASAPHTRTHALGLTA